MNKPHSIKPELDNIEAELVVTNLILTRKRQKPLDEIEIRAAALSLAAMYNGIEKVLCHILANLGEQIAQGPSWHTELIQRCRLLEIISAETTAELKGFLSFRHFVRHAYSFEIDPTTIEAVLEKAPELVQRFIEETRRRVANTSNEKSPE
jgi:uncharacterized protein YutE (UPF0331/DUF86 family)